jgi:hypothetical protein
MNPFGPAALSPVPPPPRRRLTALLVTTVAAVVSIVVLLVVAAFAINGTFRSTPSGPRSSTTTTVELHRIGERATTSGLEVTVLGFKNPQPPTSASHAAPPGQHLVSIDLRVRNPGSDSRGFTPWLMCQLTDAQHDAINPPGFDPSHLDPSHLNLTITQLAPGASAEQHVLFTVPNGATGLVFTVQGSITATGSAFALT